uniref:RanBP2-type domain-containing protein n=1 Tax=Kalanchoe fedtschenkoi TaxID=63787 RepID=A0A7N1A876_KALFE
MEGRRGGRASRGLLPFLALHAVNEYYRLERKPPVTAALLAANTLIYLRPEFLEAHLPMLDEVAFNPYLIVKDSNSGSDPIAHVIRGITGAVTWPIRFLGNLFQFGRSRRFGRGTVGQGQTRRSAEIWRCITCTFDNSGLFTVCEMCGSRRGGGDLLTVDEIRRRRLERFGR